jgi:hypothetical protein
VKTLHVFGCNGMPFNGNILLLARLNVLPMPYITFSEPYVLQACSYPSILDGVLTPSSLSEIKVHVCKLLILR